MLRRGKRIEILLNIALNAFAEAFLCWRELIICTLVYVLIVFCKVIKVLTHYVFANILSRINGPPAFNSVLSSLFIYSD